MQLYHFLAHCGDANTQDMAVSSSATEDDLNSFNVIFLKLLVVLQQPDIPPGNPRLLKINANWTAASVEGELRYTIPARGTALSGTQSRISPRSSHQHQTRSCTTRMNLLSKPPGMIIEGKPYLGSMDRPS